MPKKSGAAPAALTVEEREWAVLTLVGQLLSAVGPDHPSLRRQLAAWEREAMDALDLEGQSERANAG